MGLQVKTAGYETAAQESRVYFRTSSFRADIATRICVLGWDRAASDFAETCLLIPSVDIPRITHNEGEWMVLELEPGSESHRRLDRYRVPLATLGARVAAMSGTA